MRCSRMGGACGCTSDSLNLCYSGTIEEETADEEPPKQVEDFIRTRR